MKKYLEGFLEYRKRASEENPEALPTLEELKTEYIEYLLDRTFYNKTQTARILNISRAALYYRLAVQHPGGAEDDIWLKKTGRLSSH
jgi:DNA-binding NtrC family response regulator